MNTFCVLPWYSLEFPLWTPCCLLPKNTNIDQVKFDLLNNIKSPACSQCWDLEAQGQKSRRQQENEFLDYKLDLDLINLKKDCIESKHKTLLYQIKTSNLCNQACVSCDSGASSKWAEIERKMGLVPAPGKEINLENSNINYSDAKRISLIGGEPFFDPKTFTILEKLVEHKNTNCFISIITNGSINLKQPQLDLLSKFTDLNICISVDGIGPVFEYLRWPAKWDRVIKNISHYQKISKNISVSYTISSLNIFYYDQTVNWFTQQSLGYNHNIVTYPNWLSLTAMPVELKQLLLKNSFATPWLIVTGNEISLAEYKNKIQAQDLAKRIDIKNYLPEIAGILNN